VRTRQRIGIYICECGPNIKEAVYIEDVVDFAQGLKDVVFAKVCGLLCSDQGKDLIAKEIKDQKLTRVVIAACSPKEHEMTFRQVLAKAGLNPFLLQMANIREQCAWVISDKDLATEKSKAMIAAAVQRVVHHEPLETREITCRADVLVVGAGVAGISAALALAQKDRKVYLVERSPCIGGKVARYEQVYPNLECASCVLDPMLDEVLHHEHIEVLTLSQPLEVLGFYGNFVVKVRQTARGIDSKTCIGCGVCVEACPVRAANEYNEGLDQRKAIYIPYAGALPNAAVIDRDHCLRGRGEDCRACKDACPFGCVHYQQRDQMLALKVGAIVLATGFDTFDPRKAPQYGYGAIEEVYTSLEFERLLNSTGPTEGKILLKDGTPPRTIALVHCVGSRSTRFHEHCSGVCCMYLLKFAHQATEKLADVSVKAFYSDLCLWGKESQGFCNRVSQKNGVELVPVKAPDSVKIVKQDGHLLIKYTDVCGRMRETPSDMAVLAPAMEGAIGAHRLAEVLDIPVSPEGFFVEGHATVAPLSTLRDGVWIAGCAKGPESIPGSVAQGHAAAGNILSHLIPGQKLSLEPMTAELDESLCSGCRVCVGVCPYRAITFHDRMKRVTINEVLCRGCGLCPAACPSAAIKAKHYTDVEISAEIEGLFQQV
jgi:heterodisulfide reductase subunit A